MMGGARVWGEWGVTWQERDLEAEKEADNRRCNVLAAIRSGSGGSVKRLSERSERSERRESRPKERRKIRSNLPAAAATAAAEEEEEEEEEEKEEEEELSPPTRVGTEEEDEEEIKGRMTNKWMQDLHGRFKNEDEELEVVSKTPN